MSIIGSQNFESGILPSPNFGTVSIVPTPTFEGSYAIRVNPETTGTGWVKPYSFGASSTVYHSFYFLYATRPASGNEDIMWCSGSAGEPAGGARKMAVAITSDGKLLVRDSGGTTAATGTTVLSLGVWYKIEVKCTDGVAGDYELRINGVAELTGAINTTLGAPGNNASLLLGKAANTSGQSIDFFYDYVFSDDANYPVAVLAADSISNWADALTSQSRIVNARPNINFCGFETGDTREGTGLYTGVNIVGPVVQSTVVHSGTYALRHNVSAGPEYGYFSLWSASIDNTNTFSAATAYYRFYFLYRIKPITNPVVFAIVAGNAGTKLSLRLDASGAIKVYNRVGTLVATGATILQSDLWYRIEIKCGTGSSAAWELKIDGALEASGTSDIGTSNNNIIHFGSAAPGTKDAIDFYFDDIAISSLGYVGHGRSIIVVPSANGADNDFTIGAGSGSNYEQVDEIPPDGDTTYLLSTGIVGDAYTGVFDVDAALPSLTGGIQAVKLITSLQNNTSNTQRSLRFRSGATTYDAPFPWVNIAGVAYGSKVDLIFVDDPNTTAPWVQANMTALEGGIVEVEDGSHPHNGLLTKLTGDYLTVAFEDADLKLNFADVLTLSDNYASNRIGLTDNFNLRAIDDPAAIKSGTFINDDQNVFTPFTAIEIPIEVPTDLGAIIDVNVSVRAVLNSVDYVAMDLIHPDETEIGLAFYTIYGNTVGTGPNDCSGVPMVFDDSATETIGYDDSPYDRSFIPDQPLSTFNGKSAVGTWKLRYTSSNVTSTVGCVKLVINGLITEAWLDEVRLLQPLSTSSDLTDSFTLADAELDYLGAPIVTLTGEWSGEFTNYLGYIHIANEPETPPDPPPVELGRALILSINGVNETARLITEPSQLTIVQGQEGTTASIILDYSDGATLPAVGSTFEIFLPNNGGRTIVLRAKTVSEVTERYATNDSGFWIHQYDVVDPISILETKKLPDRKPFLNTNTGAILSFLLSSLDSTLITSLAAGNPVAAFDLKDFSTFGDVLKSEIVAGGYVLRMQNGLNVRGDFDTNFSANSDWQINSADYRYTPIRFTITPTDLLIDDVTVSPGKPIAVSRTAEWMETDPRVQSSIPLTNNVLGLEDAEPLKITAGQDISDTEQWEVFGSINMAGSHIGLNGTLVMLDARPFVAPYKVAWTGIIPDNGTGYAFGFHDDYSNFIWQVSGGDYPLSLSTDEDQYTYEISTNPTGPSSFEVWGLELHQNFTVDEDEIIAHVASVDYCEQKVTLDSPWDIDNNAIRFLSLGTLVECIDVGDEIGRAKILSRSEDHLTLTCDILPDGIEPGCPVTRGVGADQKETATLIKTVSVGDAKYGLPAMSGSGVHVKAMVIQKTGLIDGYVTSLSTPGLDQTFPRALRIDVDLTENSDGVISGSGSSAVFTLAEKFTTESCVGLTFNYVNGGKHDFRSTCGSVGGHVTLSVPDEQDPEKLQAIADRLCALGSRNAPRVNSNMESTEVSGNPLPFDPLPISVDNDYRVGVASVPIITSKLSYVGSRVAGTAPADDVLLFEVDAGEKSATERAEEEAQRGQPITKYPLRASSIGGARINSVSWDDETLIASISGAGTIYGPFGQPLDFASGVDPAKEAGVSNKHANPVKLHCTTDGGNFNRDTLTFTVIYPPSDISSDSVSCKYAAKRNIVTFAWPKSFGAVVYEIQRLFPNSSGGVSGICPEDLLSATGCASGISGGASGAHWETIDYIDGRGRGSYQLPYEPESKAIRFRGIGLCDKKAAWTEACCTLSKLPKPHPFSVLKVFEGGTIDLHVGAPPDGCDEGRARKLRIYAKAVSSGITADVVAPTGVGDDATDAALLSFFAKEGGGYDKLKIQDFPVTEDTKEQDYRIMYQEYDPGENIVIGGAWVDAFNDIGHLALADTPAMAAPGCPRKVKISWTHANGYKTKWKIPDNPSSAFQGDNADTIYQYEIVYFIVPTGMDTSGGLAVGRETVCPGTPEIVAGESCSGGCYMGADDGDAYATLEEAADFVEKQYHHVQHLDKSEIDHKFWKSQCNMNVCVRAYNIVNGIRSYGPWACSRRMGESEIEDPAVVGLSYYGGATYAVSVSSAGAFIFAGDTIQAKLDVVDMTDPFNPIGYVDGLGPAQDYPGGFQYIAPAADQARNLLYVSVNGFIYVYDTSTIRQTTDMSLVNIVPGGNGGQGLCYNRDRLYTAGIEIIEGQEFPFIYVYSAGGSPSLINKIPYDYATQESMFVAKDDVIIMKTGNLLIFLDHDGNPGGAYDPGFGSCYLPGISDLIPDVTDEGEPINRRFMFLCNPAGDSCLAYEITNGVQYLRGWAVANDPCSAASIGLTLYVFCDSEVQSWDWTGIRTQDPTFLDSNDQPWIDYGTGPGPHIYTDYGFVADNGALVQHSAVGFFYRIYTDAINQEELSSTVGGDLEVAGDATVAGALSASTLSADVLSIEGASTIGGIASFGQYVAVSEDLFIGTGAPISGSTEFQIFVSSETVKPNIRYLSLTTDIGKWQISNDGSTYGDVLTNKTVTLVDAATIATNARLANNFRISSAVDRTLGAPTNPTDGQQIKWAWKNTSGSPRTLTLDTGVGGFKFGSDITGLTATVAGKTDHLTAEYVLADNAWHVMGYIKGF